MGRAAVHCTGVGKGILVEIEHPFLHLVDELFVSRIAGLDGSLIVSRVLHPNLFVPPTVPRPMLAIANRSGILTMSPVFGAGGADASLLDPASFGQTAGGMLRPATGTINRADEPWRIQLGLKYLLQIGAGSVVASLRWSLDASGTAFVSLAIACSQRCEWAGRSRLWRPETGGVAACWPQSLARQSAVKCGSEAVRPQNLR